MPPTKKNVESSDSDSGPDDINPIPAKKLKKDITTTKHKSSGEPKTEWGLERNRIVKVNEFRGKKMIDIREYFEKDGKLLPGKKGISLSISQWKKLLEFSDEINRSLDE